MGNILHTLRSEPLQVSVPAISLSCSSDRPIMFQFLATGTKLGCGEHGYVAFVFVSLSYGFGHCCLLFFSYRLSSAHALRT